MVRGEPQHQGSGLGAFQGRRRLARQPRCRKPTQARGVRPFPLAKSRRARQPRGQGGADAPVHGVAKDASAGVTLSSNPKFVLLELRGLRRSLRRRDWKGSIEDQSTRHVVRACDVAEPPGKTRTHASKSLEIEDVRKACAGNADSARRTPRCFKTQAWIGARSLQAEGVVDIDRSAVARKRSSVAAIVAAQ